MQLVATEDLTLLGVPLFAKGIDQELSSRFCDLKLVCSRLQCLDHHDALFLLRNAFFLPKLLYILRAFPCHGNQLLKELDLCMKDCLEKITNCRFDLQTSTQVSLPVKLGGLGIRRSEDISLPAFIASSHKCLETVNRILPKSDSNYFENLLSDAVDTWKGIDSRLSEPVGSVALHQKSWDLPVAKLTISDLIKNATNPAARARLQAVSAPFSGAWLDAIPVPSLGLKLDDDSLRIAVALRLGVEIAMPYTCVCGTLVQGTATHGLDCRKVGGRHARHSSVNNILQRALNAAGVPSQLEPAGLSRDDGKRPDGATIVPWSQGQCLVWDFTCVDTVAASHVNTAAGQVGAPSQAAESKKRAKYAFLGNLYKFTPIAVETLGPWGPDANSLIRDLGSRLTSKTGDPRSAAFLRQRISLAVQWGNALCIKQSLPAGIDFNEVFYL